MIFKLSVKGGGGGISIREGIPPLLYETLLIASDVM